MMRIDDRQFRKDAAKHRRYRESISREKHSRAKVLQDRRIAILHDEVQCAFSPVPGCAKSSMKGADYFSWCLATIPLRIVNDEDTREIIIYGRQFVFTNELHTASCRYSPKGKWMGHYGAARRDYDEAAAYAISPWRRWRIRAAEIRLQCSQIVPQDWIAYYRLIHIQPIEKRGDVD